MGNLIEEFMGSMGSEVSQKMSEKTNIDQGTISQLLPVIAPMILGGLKKQKDERGGQDRVDHILNKYGDPSVLGNLDGLFQQKLDDKTTDPNLGGLLGNAGSDATNLLSQNLKGVDSGMIAKLIPMLAPVILGFLTKKRDGGTGSSGLAGLLDQDGDGSVLDDVAGLLLGGLGGNSKSSSPLGGLLGGLLGGNK
ncbi:MAG: DUF937 domain-containing protein [Ignavibacteria bacterium]|nr:DUF937 domain-containing protein [Ignavibacteria bacterium]